MSEKLSINQVILKPLPVLQNGELSDKVIKKCYFCEKKCEFQENSLHQKLSGDRFYCLFCLRNNLNTKNNRNVLILSFRSIIGSFYNQNYLLNRKLWLCEIEDYIEAHIKAGSENPLFLYDPESMLWFVDFNKVGNSKKKIPVDEVYKTVISILATFNISENSFNVKMSVLFKKYKDAIELFYRKRYRPPHTKILVPSFGESATDEKTKTFVFQDLKAKK